MAENKMVGNVSGQIVGKVSYAKATPKQTKDGREYELWELGIKLPSGCTVFISNNIWPATREKVGAKVAELENIMTRYEQKEDAYINKNDTLSLKGEGFVDLIDYVVEEEDKIKLVYTNSKHEEYYVDFENSEQPLVIKGYVSEISEDKTFITVVDGKEDYPATWHLTVKEDIGNQLVIGQGYAFKVVFEKGEAIKQDEVEQKDEFDFSADFSIESLSNRRKTEYASDKLRVIAGGLLKGCSIKIENSTFGSDEDELPF